MFSSFGDTAVLPHWHHPRGNWSHPHLVHQRTPWYESQRSMGRAVHPMNPPPKLSEHLFAHVCMCVSQRVSTCVCVCVCVCVFVCVHSKCAPTVCIVLYCILQECVCFLLCHGKDQGFAHCVELPEAQCARGATIWASAIVETRILWYFRHHCCLIVGFDALWIWHFWIFTMFHPFLPFCTHFFSFPPHPPFFWLTFPHHRDPEKAGAM